MKQTTMTCEMSLSQAYTEAQESSNSHAKTLKHNKTLKLFCSAINSDVETAVL